MLFPYTYVPHQMEKMQVYIDFIFHEVWCKAPIGLAFHPDLFAGNSDLKEVMTEFGFAPNAAKRGKSFYKDVKEIYDLFSQLQSAQIAQLKQWYRDNNEPEKICANDPQVSPIRYKDLVAKHPLLGKRLATFFRSLYDDSLLGLSELKSKIGSIKDHSRTFFDKNSLGKCPFCGICDLKGIHHTRREAYDHYLPKSRYPFNSINFRNLAPTCHECNSVYKLSKDPAHTSKKPTKAIHRRAAFYPYKTTAHSIELQIDLQHSDIAKLTPADIKLQFGPTAIAQEIDTWKDVYGIEERYKSKLCSESDGKAWLQQVVEEWKDLGKDPQVYFQVLAFNTEKRPFTDCHFLKQPFLVACQKKGIFDGGQGV